MMLHLFMDKGPWFRAKSHGYGAGLPFKWQGWVLVVSHAALLCGIGIALREQPLVMAMLVALAAVAPMPIYAARTEGGWRWRWGSTDKNQAKPRR